MKEIRVLVAHDRIGNTIAGQLEAATLLGHTDDIVVIGTAKDARDAVEKAVRLKADVVLIHASMPDSSLMPDDIKRRLPQCKLLALTGSMFDREAVHAIEQGSSGLLEVPVTLDELVEGIRLVADGGFVLPQRLKPNELLPDLRLWWPEEDVLIMHSEGASNKQIAERLGLAEEEIPRILSFAKERILAESQSDVRDWVIKRDRLAEARRWLREHRNQH